MAISLLSFSRSILTLWFQCLETGDSRANMQITLTALHTIFARHHNYLAAKLQRINPQWDDGTLYHEARRIVIAQLQHIAYNEYLPLLLGNTLAFHSFFSPTISICLIN